ncbi:MAG TPA: PucR family transcriptional regulator [Intrasporangiaceae bacterium]|nr:PucR family transcriptional regulator [Intrasporangiaceae bacterium]
MATGRQRISTRSRERIARAAGDLATTATQEVEDTYEWYRQLSAEDRSWVGLVAQSGITAFLHWLGGEGEDRPGAAGVFGTAPQELTRSISLSQTLDLVRTVVAVVEREVDGLVSRSDRQAAREAVLVYSREIAFAAAQVYAAAAEVRGAWDARLEGLVVDSVLRGEADDAIRSRAAALGWGSATDVAVIVGTTPPRSGTGFGTVDTVHRQTNRLGLAALVTVQGPRLIAIVAHVEDDLDIARALLGVFGDGPVVIGPVVPHLFAAGRSARAAISGHTAAPAWPHAPRPARADDLLAERALIGDLPARAALGDRIVRPLLETSGGHLFETATAYLDSGGNLEAAARGLFVHANTVRYRLGRVIDVTGYDVTDPHDAFTVRIALALSRLPRGARAPSGL